MGGGGICVAMEELVSGFEIIYDLPQSTNNLHFSRHCLCSDQACGMISMRAVCCMVKCANS